jgi:hypothetical protein
VFPITAMVDFGEALLKLAAEGGEGKEDSTL